MHRTIRLAALGVTIIAVVLDVTVAVADAALKWGTGRAAG